MLKLTNIPTLEELTQLCPSLSAVFWDMDGTLINTEILHEQSIALYLNSYPGKRKPKNISNFIEQFRGQTDTHVYLNLIQNNFIKSCGPSEFTEKKDLIFYRLVEETPKEILINTDLLKTLQDIKDRKVKQILVTSSESQITSFLLKYLGLEKYFNFVIAREDTKRNKPSPAPYLKALKLAQTNTNLTLVFEDSKVGIQAARAAEIKTVITANWY